MKTITVRFEDELYNKLKVHSNSQFLSKSAFIKQLVLKYDVEKFKEYELKFDKHMRGK